MHAFAVRRGKAAVLNDVVPRASGAIVVLADARQRFEPDTVRALTRPFADPAVGAVSGELILTETLEGPAVGRGVGVYWRYEKLIRKSESRVDSTVGATGAIYAIRRELFEPIPEDTLLDDVLIPLRIVRRGYRVLFEPAARAWDRVAASAGEELARKVRTLAGNFQLFVREPWLLDPRRNRIWLATVSHKGLRLLGPLLHAARLRRERRAGGRPAVPGRAGGPGALLCAGPGRPCHAELAPPKRAPVRALRRLPPQLGDRGGVLAIRHGAPERVVGARSRSPSPGHRGMETTASVTVEACRVEALVGALTPPGPPRTMPAIACALEGG